MKDCSHEAGVWTDAPTERPTERPTEEPGWPWTDAPTEQPTERPTEKPTWPSIIVCRIKITAWWYKAVLRVHKVRICAKTRMCKHRSG